MPPSFCLLPQYADELAARIKSGKLKIAELTAMTSAERRAAFADFMGEANAQHVNAAFESKLLLQNQQKGLETWVRQQTNLKPEIQRDLLSRIERMDRVFVPNKNEPFLADLARAKLGYDVTMEEAGRITELAKVAKTAKDALLAGGEDRLAYGRAKVEFSNYVSDLKNQTKTPLTVSKAVRNTAGFAKAFTAAFDLSALGRQGWKNLWAHPGIWAKNARQSFVDFAQQFGGKAVIDEVQADVLSRPNAINGRYQKAKLALGNIEEAFPTSLPEKIPGIGRVYKASEAAYTGFQYRLRADVFDKYMEIAERSGVDVNDRRQLEAIGKLVNSLTGRGNLGRLEGSAANVINDVFFSPRKLKSDIDFLTAHATDTDITPFVRKQAAINLVKVISGTAAILAIARAVKPKSVELDPRSSDFGKIRVGNTRFDVTGGMGSIAVLAARLVRRSTKSSTTGKVSEINSGKFGSQTGTDLVYNFFENKLSPAASVVRDWLEGQDRQGNKFSVPGIVKTIAVPLPVSNAYELWKDPKSAGVVAGTLADFFGIATTNYGPRKK